MVGCVVRMIHVQRGEHLAEEVIFSRPPIRRRHSYRRTRPCTHKSRLVSGGLSMSALPPKADIRQRIEHVCFVPLADTETCKD
jgi:hypothetical protein